MKISLVANTGLQFYTTELEVKAEESFMDRSGNMMLPLSIMDENNYSLPLSFYESYDVMTGLWKLELVVCFSSEQCVRLEELKQHEYPYPYVFTDINGVERVVDESKIDFSVLDILPREDCYSEYCLAGSLREKLVKGECPLDCMENHWLPMPLFERDNLGNCVFGPTGWCRMKLSLVSKVKNVRRYRVVWAYDTSAVKNDLSSVRPFFYEGETEKHYALCDNASLMFDFFAPQPFECEWVDEYVASLIHGNKENAELYNPDTDTTTHFKYLAYYITFICYLRKIEICPEVSLYADVAESKNVDLVLDIGNSRTCGVLFENSDFTKVEMLQLQDLSEPWKVYRKPFDMRLAFHHCKFGEMDIQGQFEWQSFLRVGDEAIKLIYQSRPLDGVSERTTNYSSPKRYLWDNKQFSGQWDFLTTQEDASTSLNHYINIKGLSEQFDSDGALRTSKNGGIFSSFSRRSLMTFVMIEIFQQANCQINSFDFRTKHGDVDVPRKLGKIIVTCPTAMSKEEQIALRKCAEEAYIALLRCKDPELYYEVYDPKEWRNRISVIPSVKDLSASMITGGVQMKTEWAYDEATCCQLVYLYAEIAQRYRNQCQDFFELYGHIRKEFLAEGYQRNSLTVGSIDIGAGTTDLMICAYQYDEKGVSKLTPKPLFWDSFYYAGDDVLEEIIRMEIIEGAHKDMGNLNWGPIFNAVCSAYMSLSDDDFLDALNLRNKIYFDKMPEAEKNTVKYSIASRETSERIHNFFGHDKALMDYKDRIMRQDFNVQISVPMGLKMLELLRLGRKNMLLRYEDFFPDLKPAGFILDHFSRHFSLVQGGKHYMDIDFTKILWNFNPQELAAIIISRLEPLMKQLAIVLNTYHCDIVLLAGKPTSLDAVTDLFLKYYPISPNRLIRLNDYRVGEWYPFSDGLGYFKDQKSLVAVGAMIGYMSSNGGIGGFHMDMTHLKKDMSSTAKYMGLYNAVNQKVTEAIITPEQNSVTFEVHGFPLYIGCKQLISQYYQARPLYALHLEEDVDLYAVSMPLKISVSRNYSQDREVLKIVSAVDSMGKPFPLSKLKFNVQSLASESAYWLDKGEFVLSING